MSRIRIPVFTVALVLLLGSARTAHAGPLTLISDWFFTDRPGWSMNDYWFTAGEYGGFYGFSVDFYLEGGEDIDDSTLSVSYYDGQNYYYDFDYSGAVDGDQDVTMLNAGFSLPPNSTGEIWAEFSIYFSDGTVLYDFRYVELD